MHNIVDSTYIAIYSIVRLLRIESLHRPHCSAKDRLHLWLPESSRSTKDVQGRPVTHSRFLIFTVPLTPSDIQCICDVMLHGYSEGTRESYGSGLLIYHVFCDSKSIPETQRAPASSILIESFISAMAGNYSRTTIANYIFGVWAWHVLHSITWDLNDMQIKTLLKATVSLTPSTCEFTVPRLDSFDLNLHVTRNNITDNFHLPHTKSALEGEDVHWAQQHGPSDPEEAFNNHIRINDPPVNTALFSYRLASATRAAGRKPVNGHGIRINSTLEYLL
ncbi:hypothetical protein P692DRAFT_201842457 [Suillus brevipes Sb2]|nr:hypothetical protein P692DRAFT_201842457 [Suillus brevipes Sb2]